MPDDDPLRTDSDTRALMKALPDWIFDRRLRTRSGLTTFIIGAVATWVVASIFGLWRAVLGIVESLYVNTVIIIQSIGNTVAMAFRPGWQLLAFMDWMALQIESFIVSLGLFAPIGAAASWLVVMLIVAVILNALIGLASTYLPLRSLPWIGRWFR